MKRSRTAGFSMIELMVVVVITAILAASRCRPTTARSASRGAPRPRRPSWIWRRARNATSRTQNVYTTDPAALAYGSGAWPISIGTYYSITSVSSSPASATTPGGYVLQVQPSAGSTQLQDTACQTFQVDQTGKQSSLDNNSNDSSTTCWP